MPVILVCQTHLDIPYGTQCEPPAVMQSWRAEKFPGSALRLVCRVRDERRS
jgi:hypothetical protein